MMTEFTYLCIVSKLYVRYSFELLAFQIFSVDPRSPRKKEASQNTNQCEPKRKSFKTPAVKTSPPNWLTEIHASQLEKNNLSMKRIISAAADLQLGKTSTNACPRRTKGLQMPKKQQLSSLYRAMAP
jgi:hypothetical protein